MINREMSKVKVTLYTQIYPTLVPIYHGKISPLMVMVMVVVAVVPGVAGVDSDQRFGSFSGRRSIGIGL